MAFVNGQAVFQLESIRLRSAIHERLLERLSEGVRLHKTFNEVRADLDPLPKGELFGHVTGVCQTSTAGCEARITKLRIVLSQSSTVDHLAAVALETHLRLGYSRM